MATRRPRFKVVHERDEIVTCTSYTNEDVLMTNAIVHFQPMFTSSTLCSPHEMANRVLGSISDLASRSTLGCIRDVNISGYKISDFIYPSSNVYIPDVLYTYLSCFLDPYSHELERQYKQQQHQTCVDSTMLLLESRSLSRSSSSSTTVPSQVGKTGLRVSSCSSWYNVQMVEVFSVSNTCQICLDTCCAPVVTRCGHFFCLPCFQHYLDTCAERRCPMCFKSLTCIDDVRLCRINVRKQWRRGDICDLRIVVRQRGCSYPFKANAYDVVNNNIQHVNHSKTVNMSKYQRYCNAVDIRYMYDEHKKQIQQKMQSRQQELGLAVPTTPSSSSTTEEQKLSFIEPSSEFSVKKKNKKKETTPPESQGNSWSTPLVSKKQYVDPGAEEEFQFYLMALEKQESWSTAYMSTPLVRWIIEYEQAMKMKWKQRENILSKPVAPHIGYHCNNNVYMKDYVYSYQASDGSPVFLHPYLFRCLQNLTTEVLSSTDAQYSDIIHNWQSLLKKHGRCAVPLVDVQQLPVIQLENLSITNETKKKYSFIAHLPYYTEVTFLICDVTAVLPNRQSTLEAYKQAESYILQTYQRIHEKEQKDAADKAKREVEQSEDQMRQVRLYNSDTVLDAERGVHAMMQQEFWENRHSAKAKSRKSFQAGFVCSEESLSTPSSAQNTPTEKPVATTKWSNLAKSGHKNNYFDGKDPFSSL